MRDFKKYEVWQLGHILTLKVYKTILPKFPASEKFDLYSQTKRAAYSIPLNIAEGCGRNSDKDFARFLDNAFGSAQELEYALILARDLGYLEAGTYAEINESVQMVKAKLIKLIKSLRLD